MDVCVYVIMRVHVRVCVCVCMYVNLYLHLNIYDNVLAASRCRPADSSLCTDNSPGVGRSKSRPRSQRAGTGRLWD